MMDGEPIYDRLIVKEIHSRKCYLFRNGGEGQKLPIFYWGIMPDHEKAVRTVISCLKKCQNNTDFLLAAYESENWNDDFSPWEAPPVFGTESFGGEAGKTLKWLTDCCIPYIESDGSGWIKDAKEIMRFTAGYSLAGLFGLWAYFESAVFAGAVSCSGSLWYEGFSEYVQRNEAVFDKKVKENRLSCIYLSLGDKEGQTKNKRMSTVGDHTKALYDLIRKKHSDVKCMLEWNKGGHFSETDIRVAKGICRVLKCI